jgi:hypothetical protein
MDDCSDQNGAPSPVLQPEGAFVVQFAVGAGGRTAMSGRVEHVVSGHAARFQSVDELLRFVEHMLSKLNQ